MLERAVYAKHDPASEIFQRDLSLRHLWLRRPVVQKHMVRLRSMFIKDSGICFFEMSRVRSCR